MHRFIFLTLLYLLLVACGPTFEVGIERTPTPDSQVAGTIAALETARQTQGTQIAQLSTQVATTGASGQPSALATAVITGTGDLGKVAYLVGGDIWVKPLPNGTPRRLTNDGRNRDPSWSPSGEWLAFRKEGELWVMRADGSTARPIQQAILFAWSPTDDRLAYTHNEWGAILVIAPNALPNTGTAGDGTLVFQGESDDDGFTEIPFLQWNYEGTSLGFSTLRRRSEDWTVETAALWTALADASSDAERYYVVEDDEGLTLELVGWSPDDSALLFIRNYEYDSQYDKPLERLALDGSDPTDLFEPVLPYPDFVDGWPDGGVMVMVGGGGRATYENKRLALTDGSATQAYYVTDEVTPAISPEIDRTNGRIAYVAQSGENGLQDRHLWLLDDAGAVQQITNDPDFRDEHPNWSADGAYLLFARIDRDGLVSLWLLTPDGGTPQLVIPEITPAPSWWGDEGHIVWEELYDWHR